KIDHAYASDYTRAKMTAEEILRYHPHLPLNLVADLRERNKGSFIGKSYEEGRRAVRESGAEPHMYRWPGGESALDVQQRAAGFLDMLKERHYGETVLAVSHGIFMTVFMLYLQKQGFNDWEQYTHENTGITEIIFREDGHDIVRKNCTRHLG
ncbi:TPA: histidine phosphatase family protein, partial [Candidatus Woesearchaeota archaeon]|nr:histidine phosphatase family protein [Candidatus Woesearchaeota archaeon]